VSEVRIADEVRVDAPIDAVWRAIEDPAAHAGWHPFVSMIEGGHELGEIRLCSVLVGKNSGTTKERCVERETGLRIVWAVEEDPTGFGRMVSGWRWGSTWPPARARRSSPRRAAFARATSLSGRCCP
jgi:uncharacterized protein YndB with AHSA1/START domain